MELYYNYIILTAGLKNMTEENWKEIIKRLNLIEEMWKTTNSRMNILDSRILRLENKSNRLHKSLNLLNSNGEVILKSADHLVEAINVNDKADETAHETLFNRMKGIKMSLGRQLVRIKQLEENSENKNEQIVNICEQM